MTPSELAETLRLHELWLRGDPAGTRANLTSANLYRADLTGADLTRADLTRADLARANLYRADLTDATLAGADLTWANLTGADLTRANLAGAHLSGANLTSADLSGAKLSGANLADADLSGADLTSANLAGANLTGATMPDGRAWEEYRADHLAGICTSPEVHARAIEAWGSHEWTSCPMHSALGISDTTEITDAALRRNVAAWVALYDAGQLQPYTTPSPQDTP
jgi:hypothetical protein